MTQLELLLHLERHGWARGVWLDAGSPAAVDVLTGSPKKWWVKPGAITVGRQYLLALARLADARPEFTTVEHLKPESYYKRLFKPPKALVMEGDVGVVG
eukprot:9372599-Pyramimonas_sp.AAC.1